MKTLIALILLTQIANAKPLERNAITKANKTKLEKFIGASNEDLIKTTFKGATRTKSKGKITDTYLFKYNESCAFSYYFDDKGIITDIEVSSSFCFGKHEARSSLNRTLAGQD